jgi:hypothetical protein
MTLLTLLQSPAGAGNITLTAGTSVESTGSVTSTTVTLPSGLVAGDYTIIVVSLNATTGVITTPSGWTNILASTQATASTSDVLAIFYRKWQSGDTNPAVTTTSGRVAATPIRVQGADGTTFVDTAASVTQASAGATTITAPTITPSDTCLINVWNGRSGSTNVFLDPWTSLTAGLTKVAEANGRSTTQTNAGHCIATQTVSAGVATGTKNATSANSTTGAMGVSFALNVAPGGGGTQYDKTQDDAVGLLDAVDPVQDLVRDQPDAVGILDSVTADLTPGGTGSMTLDASTPALVFNNGGTAADCIVTTGNFTPPAGALLIAATNASASGAGFEDPMVTITDSAGSNVDPWTVIDRATVTTTSSTGVGGGVASLHWAKVVNSVSMTVTSTQNTSPPQEGSPPTYLKIWVITGADTTSPVGDTDKGFTTNNTMVTGSMTTTRANSWIVATGTEWSAGGTAGPNHPDLNIGTYVFDDTVDILVGAGGAKEIATSGSTVTATIDAAGTATREWLWVAAEIKAAPAGGTDYDKTPADAVGITDAPAWAQERTASDTAGITDSVLAELSKGAADPVGILDSATFTMDAARTQPDAVGITDARTLDVGKSISDTAGITDSATGSLTLDRTQADPVGIMDSVTAEFTGVSDKNVADPVGILDSATTVATNERNPADPVGIPDSATVAFDVARLPADTAGILDLVVAVQAIARDVADPVGITDSVTGVLGNQVVVGDSVGLSDALTFVSEALRDVTDPEGITDSATTAMVGTRFVTDALPLSDTAEIVQEIVRQINESLGLADTQDPAMERPRGADDPTALTDSVTSTMALVREPADTEGLSDAVQFIMNRFHGPTDSVGITDSVTAILGSQLKDYALAAVPLATRWTVAGLDERWSYIALSVSEYVALGLVDPYETRPLQARWSFGPLPGENMDSVTIIVSAGAKRYVGGTITEKTGKDISGATFQISLGSESLPGRTWLTPDSSVPGDTNASRIVKYLVSSTTPSGLVRPGTYWAWVRVTDTPEIEPLRVQGPIYVR